MPYHAPTELEEALDLLGSGDVTVVAGGTDYFPARDRYGPRPALLDVTRIGGFRGITRARAGGWRIGGATRWSDIVHADLPLGFDGLKAAAREVGSLQIQNAGTIAGNLCNASPAADGVPPLLTLGALVELVGAQGPRQMPLEEFLTGPRQTALKPDELLSAVLVPDLPESARAAFEKLGSRRYLVISISMVAVLVVPDDEGRIAEARVAVGACSPVACRLPSLEADLAGCVPDEVVISPEHLTPLSPIDDVRGSGAFRREAVAEQIRRALRRACNG